MQQDGSVFWAFLPFFFRPFCIPGCDLNLTAQKRERRAEEPDLSQINQVCRAGECNYSSRGKAVASAAVAALYATYQVAAD